MKTCNLASTYLIQVDGMDLGLISYPFPVCLKPQTLISLREEIGRRAGIKVDGIKIYHISRAQRKEQPSKNKAKRIRHRGKVS